MNVVTRFKTIGQDTAFLKKTARLAIPVAIQGFLNTILNMIDSIMIGTLGESTIAAVGLANKVFFVYSLLLFGICSGAGILAAQYWGTKDVPSIKKVLGISLIIATAAAILFTIPALLIPNQVMRIFTPSKSAIAVGVSYLSVVALSYPFIAITNCYVAILRSVNRVKAPVIISLVALVINASINYTLIFGHFGAPKLGVTGAAIGTVVARIVECGCLLVLVYKEKNPAAAKLKELFSFQRQFVYKFFQTASPVILNEFMWGLGVTIYALAYGRMGDGAVAAITITQTYEQVLIVVFQSISVATAVILGNELGAGKMKRAHEYSKNFIVMQLALTVVVAIICYFLRWPIISLYTVTDEVARSISLCFLVFIVFMPFKMFNFVNIVGILRSGGDTKAALFLDTTGVWFIGVPLAFIGGLVLGYPIHVVYALVMIEEIYKFVLGLKRYQQKKWLRNLISEDGAEA